MEECIEKKKLNVRQGEAALQQNTVFTCIEYLKQMQLNGHSYQSNLLPKFFEKSDILDMQVKDQMHPEISTALERY